MPNKILKIILKPKNERSIFEVKDLLAYEVPLSVNSREWKYFYQLRKLFQ